MRTPSTRLRLGAALAVTTLGLFALGGSAFAGEAGQGDDHRNDRAGNRTEVPTEVDGDDDSAVPTPVDDSDNLHPSGNDRHEDKGTQGQSTSDPDDDGNGPDRNNDDPGADKPGAGTDPTGGVDEADQDGNNGCGNDDDFEDDNEGWCGAKPKPATPVTTPPGPDVDDVTVVVTTGGEVLATDVQPDAAPTAGFSTQVLGVSLERPAAAAVPEAAAVSTPQARVLGVSLARTGFSTMTLASLGAMLVLLGLGLTRKPKGVHFA